MDSLMEIDAGTENPTGDNNENVIIISSNSTSASEMVSQIAKLLSPKVSPSKKRKRSSCDEDDGSTCSICFDSFVSSGDHRIVSLKCGHIFGESCVRRWLQESQQNKCCPQCKTRATNRDLRFIYATKIKSVDNTREQELMLEVQKLQKEKIEVVTENSLNTMRVKTLIREKRLLEDELELLRNSVSLTTGRATAGIRSIKTGRMYLEKNLDFKENLESRLLRYLTKTKKLVVTQKAAESSLFPGFGVKLIDFSTYRAEKFINTSNKSICDFSIDATESLVLTASKDSNFKSSMYNLATTSVVATFTPSTCPIWSCAFDSERPQHLLLGDQRGVTYIYDTRMPNAVKTEVSESTNKSPVKLIIPMKRTECFPQGGFFVVHARGLFFYEYLPSAEISSVLLNFTDPILMATYDDRTEMLLITKSPTGQGVELKQSRHYLMKLVKEDEIPTLQEIYSFNGNNSSLPSMSRPSQIKVPDGVVVASYHQDSKMLQMRTPSADLLHEISQNDLITDICPIYLENSLFFGALSHSRCRLFKVNLGY